MELALEIIAAIIVDEIAIPKFPKKRIVKNKPQLLIKNASKNITKRKVIAMFIIKTRIILKINLPLNKVAGAATN